MAEDKWAGTVNGETIRIQARTPKRRQYWGLWNLNRNCWVDSVTAEPVADQRHVKWFHTLRAARAALVKLEK